MYTSTGQSAFGADMEIGLVLYILCYTEATYTYDIYGAPIRTGILVRLFALAIRLFDYIT